MENKKNKGNKYLILGIACLFVLVLGALGVSFAYWSVNLQQTNSNVITTGCVKLNTPTEGTPISLTNSYPISDSEGQAKSPFTFTIQNACANEISYQLNLDILTGSTMPLTSVKYKLDTASPALLSAATEATPYKNYSSGVTASSSKRLTTGTLTANEKKAFSLRLWIDSATTINSLSASSGSKTFNAKLVVTATPKA